MNEIDFRRLRRVLYAIILIANYAWRAFQIAVKDLYFTIFVYQMTKGLLFIWTSQKLFLKKMTMIPYFLNLRRKYSRYPNTLKNFIRVKKVRSSNENDQNND